MNIYENKNSLKSLIVAVGVLIAVASLWYTNLLVKNLQQREQRLIDLYAKGLKALIAENNNDNLAFLFNEIIETNDFIPVILTDGKRQPVNFKNIEIKEKWSAEKKEKFVKKKLLELQQTHEPILIEITPGMFNYIYYGDSQLLNQLKFWNINYRLLLNYSPISAQS